jgi:TM2 domain-containing membrane protein YozV
MSTYTYPNPQAIFYQQFQSVRRDEVVGILLALFLGTFGAHHFYLRRTGLGVLYCLVFWSGIPTILGFIECFFMAGRVREFNAIQAAGIAAALGIAVPAWGSPVNVTVNVPQAPNVPPAGGAPVMAAVAPSIAAGFVAPAPVACPNCQKTNAAGARFCAGCGTAL